MEAGLDQKLDTKKGGVGSLDDIRARSRLDAEHALSGRGQSRRGPGINVRLLATVAVLTAVTVAALLLLAQRRASAPGRRALQTHEEARAAYDQAMADLAGGDPGEALRELRRIAGDHAGTKLGAEAAAAATDAVWALSGATLSDAARAEEEGNFAAAFRAYDALAQQEPGEALVDLTARRRARTLALARAHFDYVDQAAQARLEQQDRNGALRLYREARTGIGVPDLQEQADQRIEQIGQ